VQIKDFLSVIQKRWWLVLLVAAVAAATAFGYSLTQPRSYESVVNVVGTPAKPDEGLNNTIKSQVKRYPALLTSNTLAQKIDERGKFDLGSEAISAKIKPQAVPDSYMLKITVNDSDRFRAARIADAAAEVIKEDNLASLAGVPDDSKIFFDKISPAPVPERPSTPRTSLNTAAGAALGLVLGLILIFLINFFDSSLKTEEEVERYTALKVIGVVPPWRNSSARPVSAPPQRQSYSAAADASVPPGQDFSPQDTIIKKPKLEPEQEEKKEGKA